MKLTLSFLRNISLPQSYERGEDYYHNGLISKLVKQGNEYTAEVWGSYRYKVWIGLGNDKFESTCNCPYDYSGPCKHIVAVGLGIINEEFDKIVEVVEVEEIEPNISSKDFFEKYYDEAHSTQKDVFLSQLLKKDEKLREQFIQFVRAKEAKVVKTDLDLIAEEVATAIENCDLDEDTLLSSWEEFFGYSAQEEGEENIEDAIKELLDEELTPFKVNMQKQLQKGRPDEALRILLGIYEGIQQTEFQSDYYEEEGRLIAELLVDEYLKELVEFLEKAVVSVRDASNMIYLIFERWDKKKKELMPHGNIKYEYDLVKFIPIWEALVSDTATSQALRLRLEAYSIYDASFADLYLHIASYQQDQILKQKVMTDFALHDINIGRSLFYQYWKENKKGKALKLARGLFDRWPDKISKELIDIIKPEEDKGLYISFLEKLAGLEGSLDYYIKLKGFISGDQAKFFVENQRSNMIYYMELLAFEQDYEKILEYVKARAPIQGNRNLDILLVPILNVYPTFCYDFLIDRIKKLGNFRGRSTYREICQLLLLLKKIESFRNEVNTLVEELYSQRLPALKDEMRRSKLI